MNALKLRIFSAKEEHFSFFMAMSSAITATLSGDICSVRTLKSLITFFCSIFFHFLSPLELDCLFRATGGAAWDDKKKANSLSVCGSQRNKDKIVALKARRTAYMRKKSRARELTLPDSRMVSMGVLSDDFATVDLREDYANLSLPKEAKFKR